jgi:type IV secretion system protein VirD4
METGAGQLCLLMAVIAIIALLCCRPKWRGSGRGFGTATWASFANLMAAGMLGTHGLILGKTRRGDLIWMPRYTHLSVFAPTSAGKGVSFVVPWLLTYRAGSCVATDPKGENFRLTADRRRALGQTVVRLDPFGVCGDGADRFNILDLIGSGLESVDDCRAAAEAMVPRMSMGEEKDPHWNDQAANVITGLLALITARFQEQERTLSSLREIVTDAELFQQSVLHLRDMGGVYARLSGVMAQLEDKERAGVLSTVNRHTTFLDSVAILKSTSRSTFNARQLLEGNMTIFLILPPHQISAQSRWLRLVITALIRLIGQDGEMEKNQ